MVLKKLGDEKTSVGKNIFAKKSASFTHHFFIGGCLLSNVLGIAGPGGGRKQCKQPSLAIITVIHRSKVYNTNAKRGSGLQTGVFRSIAKEIRPTGGHETPVILHFDASPGISFELNCLLPVIIFVLGADQKTARWRFRGLGEGAGCAFRHDARSHRSHTRSGLLV